MTEYFPFNHPALKQLSTLELNLIDLGLLDKEGKPILNNGGVTNKTVLVPSGTIGVVHQLTAGLTPPINWSKVSGSSNITIATSGAVSLTAALASGVSQSAIVRGVSGTSAVEFQLTLTGRVAPALPVNTAPPSITGTPIVGGDGTINPGAWTGADTLTWGLTANGVTYDDASPFFVWDAAWEGYQVLLTIAATNEHGSTTATYLSDVVQPASSSFWQDGVFGGPSGTAIYQFDKWGE